MIIYKQKPNITYNILQWHLFYIHFSWYLQWKRCSCYYVLYRNVSSSFAHQTLSFMHTHTCLLGSEYLDPMVRVKLLRAWFTPCRDPLGNFFFFFGDYPLRQLVRCELNLQSLARSSLQSRDDLTHGGQSTLDDSWSTKLWIYYIYMHVTYFLRLFTSFFKVYPHVLANIVSI
jgi:hypothetical protein